MRELDKEESLNFQQGHPIRRHAFLVVLDNDDGATYEATVSLNEGLVTDWRQIEGVQPRIMFQEFFECEAVVKSNPDYRDTLVKRGISDPDLVVVDPWSAGHYGFNDEEGRRLALARSFLRSGPTDNGYARPIEGLSVLVDLNAMEVMRIDDYGVVPLPPNPGNYAAEFVGEFRQDLKPLEITQPEGPSFKVDSHGVSWQKWHLRIGFTPREGLVLYTVGYECRCSAIPSSLSVQRKCPHYGECDIDAERTGKTSGTQPLTGRAYDDRAGSDIDGSERTPHQAHTRGIQTGGSSRTCSRQSGSQTCQHNTEDDFDRHRASDTYPIHGSKPHAPERVAQGAGGHRHRQEHVVAHTGERRGEQSSSAAAAEASS